MVLSLLSFLAGGSICFISTPVPITMLVPIAVPHDLMSPFNCCRWVSSFAPGFLCFLLGKELIVTASPTFISFRSLHGHFMIVIIAPISYSTIFQILVLKSPYSTGYSMFTSVFTSDRLFSIWNNLLFSPLPIAFEITRGRRTTNFSINFVDNRWWPSQCYSRLCAFFSRM